MKHLPEHANIVTSNDTYEDDIVVHLVMELCEGGELFDRIVARGHYTEMVHKYRELYSFIVAIKRFRAGVSSDSNMPSSSTAPGFFDKSLATIMYHLYAKYTSPISAHLTSAGLNLRWMPLRTAATPDT
ncbi:hypothetical protein RJ640_030918 [Escallonia rubra]|uniref:Uncharacterized protein n=1 Tax=Escallonia rubra TaxID=112253 RepID=A0AA88UBQ7_9ASTE|nr:hypothetical protein RJ640_030918 [Escallonia rubra]